MLPVCQWSNYHKLSLSMVEWLQVKFVIGGPVVIVGMFSIFNVLGWYFNTVIMTKMVLI